MSLGGTVVQVRNLAESMQVAFDADAKRILLPMSSVADIPTVPGELFAKLQMGFYSDPVESGITCHSRQAMLESTKKSGSQPAASCLIPNYEFSLTQP